MYYSRTIYYNDNYDKITESDNPKYIDTVSMLRHYINCHGYTKKLEDYLKPLTEDQIDYILSECKGYMDIDELIDDFDGVIEEEQEKQNKIYDAQEKNAELIMDFYEVKVSFAGMDLRNIKQLLTKLGKTDPIASAYRQLLEIEDVNVRAKEAYGYYQEKIYKKKYELIMKLVQHCSQNGYVYGKQDAEDTPHIHYVIYFEIPGCKQISFHTNFEGMDDLIVPDYEKEWDGIVNSTFGKLDQAIKERYSEEIKQKKDVTEKRKEAAKKREEKKRQKFINEGKDPDKEFEKIRLEKEAAKPVKKKKKRRYFW